MVRMGEKGEFGFPEQDGVWREEGKYCEAVASGRLQFESLLSKKACIATNTVNLKWYENCINLSTVKFLSVNNIC
jgi:hypothetical protein